MTSLSHPNVITNGDATDGAKLEQNFDAIDAHCNTELINRDGGVAMTGQLSLVGDPVAAGDAARKSYVDGVASTPARAGCVVTAPSASRSTTGTNITWTAETHDSHTFWTSSTGSIVVPSGLGGVYVVTATLSGAQTDDFYFRITKTNGGSQASGHKVGAALGDSACTASGLYVAAAGDGFGVSVWSLEAGAINLSATLSLYRVSV